MTLKRVAAKGAKKVKEKRDENIEEYLKDFHFRLMDLGFQVDVACCVSNNIEPDFESELNQLLIDDCQQLVDLTT